MERIKKEIKFRGSRRGIKELDIIFGSFIVSELENLSVQELEDFRQLLLQPDVDLFCWFEKGDAPNAFNTPVFKKIHSHNKSRLNP